MPLPCLAGLRTARARTGAPPDAPPPSGILEWSDRLPKDLWSKIVQLVAEDDACANIAELCALEKDGGAARMPWSRWWCEDDGFYETINKRLGWYGAFASLEAVRARFQRPGTDVEWSVPETAKAYFEDVCAAFATLGTNGEQIESDEFFDAYRGRPYFVPLAKRAVRIDPEALAHVPYVPGYAEIAATALRLDDKALVHLFHDTMDYEEYVRLATIAVAQNRDAMDIVMRDWTRVLEIDVDSLDAGEASNLATDLVIACIRSRERDVQHLVRVMNDLVEIGYGRTERVDVARVFQAAVAFCATEHAARVEAVARLERAGGDARTNPQSLKRAKAAREESVDMNGLLANLALIQLGGGHEAVYRAAVAEAATDFDVLCVWMNIDCPVVEYVDPWSTPRYIEVLEYLARHGDASELRHVRPGALAVETYCSIAEMAVTRGFKYLGTFAQRSEFTREGQTNLAILAMRHTRSHPSDLWPDPNRFLTWFMSSYLRWKPGTTIGNLYELAYDLREVFEAAAAQIGEAAKDDAPYDPRVYQRAHLDRREPPVRAHRTNWLLAQYDRVLSFSRCHELCLARVLDRMWWDFNGVMLLLRRRDFEVVSRGALAINRDAAWLERIGKVAPPDIARDGVVVYPDFKAPDAVVPRDWGEVVPRDGRAARAVWTERVEWLRAMREWSQQQVVTRLVSAPVLPADDDPDDPS